MPKTTLEAEPISTGLEPRLSDDGFRPLLDALSGRLFDAECGRTRVARYGAVLSSLADGIGEGNVLERLWSFDNTTPEQRNRWHALIGGDGITAPFYSPHYTRIPEQFRSVSIFRHHEKSGRAHVSMDTPRFSRYGRGYEGYLISNVVFHPGDDVSALTHRDDRVRFYEAVDRYGRTLVSRWPLGRGRRLHVAIEAAVQESYGIASRNRGHAEETANVVLTIAGIVYNGAHQAGIDLRWLNPHVPRDAAILRLLACGDAIAMSRGMVLDPRKMDVE